MLKLLGFIIMSAFIVQPPLGGCVLKQREIERLNKEKPQPPLGGCVLKPSYDLPAVYDGLPAAFRRLCVETTNPTNGGSSEAPAAFRRLCVETSSL